MFCCCWRFENRITIETANVASAEMCAFSRAMCTDGDVEVTLAVIVLHMRIATTPHIMGECDFLASIRRYITGDIPRTINLEWHHRALFSPANWCTREESCRANPVINRLWDIVTLYIAHNPYGNNPCIMFFMDLRRVLVGRRGGSISHRRLVLSRNFQRGPGIICTLYCTSTTYTTVKTRLCSPERLVF